MTSKALIGVAFKLTGPGFLPDDLTAAIGLRPTRTWRRGDAVQGTQLKRQHDGWAYELPVRESHDMEPILRELLEVLEPHAPQIAELGARLILAKDISFVAYVRGEAPACWLSADTVRRLAALDANFDVDFILME